MYVMRMLIFLILNRTDVIMKEKSRVVQAIGTSLLTVVLVLPLLFELLLQPQLLFFAFFKVFNYLLVLFLDCWNFLLYLPMRSNLTVMQWCKWNWFTIIDQLGFARLYHWLNIIEIYQSASYTQNGCQFGWKVFNLTLGFHKILFCLKKAHKNGKFFKMMTCWLV